MDYRTHYKIFDIVCIHTGNILRCSTKGSIKQYMTRLESGYKSYLQKKKNSKYLKSFDIISRQKYKVVLVKELFSQEAYNEYKQVQKQKQVISSTPQPEVDPTPREPSIPYYKKHRDERLAYQKEYYEKNRDTRRAYYASRYLRITRTEPQKHYTSNYPDDDTGRSG